MWEQRASTRPEIRTIWRAVVDEAADYTDEASEHWGLSFIRRPDGSLAAELAGPRIAGLPIRSRTGEAYWGVELAAHVVIRGVDKALLRGAIAELPVSDGRVTIAGRCYPVPTWEELEPFVAQLVADGLLVADLDVRRALAGDDRGLSRRSWQRRFTSVTGLRRKEIERLDRCRRAHRLLTRGVPPADVAIAVGYADQAHLTRELRRIRGQTPARILAAAARRRRRFSSRTSDGRSARVDAPDAQPSPEDDHGHHHDPDRVLDPEPLLHHPGRRRADRLPP